MGNDQEVVDRDLEALEEESQEAEPSFFADPKRIVETLFVVLLMVAAIYVLVPKAFDTQNALDKLGDANAIWIAIRIARTKRPRRRNATYARANGASLRRAATTTNWRRWRRSTSRRWWT